jgi:hypothetical protein
MALPELGRGQVPLKDNAKRVLVRNAKEAKCADEHMDINRVEIRAEEPLVLSSLQDGGQDINDADVQGANGLRLLNVPAKVHVFGVDETNELRVSLLVVERQFDETSNASAGDSGAASRLISAARSSPYTFSRAARYRPSLLPK